MNRSNWDEWRKPDMDSIAGLDADQLPFQGYTRRSIVPDALSVLIAAESGKPILYPIFPINGFGPQAPCAHKGPIPDGHAAYCPTCHDTGLRDHPALKLCPADLPEPEPKPGEAPVESRPEPTNDLTRKQRRAQLYGRADASAATA